MSSTHCFLCTSICHGCKVLNFRLAIHFNSSVTFLLRVLEML